MAQADVITRWHRIFEEQDYDALDELLAEDCCFFSPVVHTPQRGRALTRLYLQGASAVLMPGGFRYLDEIVGDNRAMLEFETEIDGIKINGVDIISWNEKWQITEFKVLIRPLKAIHVVHQKMGEMLGKIKG